MQNILRLALLIGLTSLAQAGEGWTVDFTAAKAQANKEGKDLLLEFTGSDWCPPCKALTATVFEDPLFEQMGAHFVLVKLDYPRDTSKQTKAEIAQNKELKGSFGIKAYPTVVLTDAGGKAYERLEGYRGETTILYMESLLEARGKKHGKTFKLDLPGQTADNVAFNTLFKEIEVRRVAHILLCTGSDEGLLKIKAFLDKFTESRHREEVEYLRAVSYWSMGRYAESAPHFGTFAKAYPESRLYNLALVRQADANLRSDQPAKALEVIAQIKSLGVGGYPIKAQALSLLGQNKEAIACMEEALAAAGKITQGSKMKARAEGMAKEQIRQLKMIGEPLLEFAVKAHKSGKEITPASFKGKVVLVDFWATWCGPCMREMPTVLATYAKYNARGFEILGVSLDRTQKPLDQVVATRKMEWDQFFDGQGWKNELAQLFGIRRIPFAMLVDRKGNVRYINLTGPSLDRLVGNLLDEE